jgi:predicted  nucleic acid-binding Zn-ribbon protein
MREIIEKLLILQDRDRRIQRVKGELGHIGPERQMLHAKADHAQAALEKAKHQLKQIEVRRKELELEVEGKKGLIVKYANQQFQTRKNEEYRALAHEIETCKQAIFQTEDQEIVLMEEEETVRKDIARANQVLMETRKLVEDQVAQLGGREQHLQRELEQLLANRDELAGALDDAARGRYERLLRSKGENVIVGIQHGVCGGCHMRVPPQLLVSCQAARELVTCSNCGRILYYTRDMDLAVAD